MKITYSKVNYSNRYKRRKNPILVLLIVLISIAVVGGGGYFAISKINENAAKQEAAKKPKIKELTDKEKLDIINKKADVYPASLAKVANEKPELVNFVYDYPKKKNPNNTKTVAKESLSTHNKFPLFSQWDDRWGYTQYGDDFMAITGCAPTTVAMAAVGLTGNKDITPKIVADYSEQNGFYVKGAGTSWDFINKGGAHFGINAHSVPISANTIINTLKKGNPMIIVLKPGHFTTVGHFILLTGVTEDNRIIVNDPFSHIRSNEKWDVDVFVKEGKNLWTVTKQ